MSNTGYTRIVRSLIAAETVAEIVSDKYDLPAPLLCRLFCVGENDNYVISAGGQRYFLRLYVSGKHWPWERDDYYFELEWLTFLRAHGVPVSFPIPLNNGNLLGTINAPEGPRNFALFTYAPGKVDNTLEDPQRVINLGQAIAKLHQVSDYFKPRYHRFQVDLKFLIGSPLARISGYLMEFGRRKDVDFLTALAEKLVQSISRLPVSLPEYGIIGGDFHRSNFHFSEDSKITLFDFDHCGYGWRAYDLSVFLWDVRANFAEDTSLLRMRLIEGYQSIRRLTDLELSALPSLIKARHLWMLGEHVADIPVIGASRIGDEYWDENMALLKRWSIEDSQR